MSVIGHSGGIFDYENLVSRRAELAKELESPDVWSDAVRAKKIGREKTDIEKIIRRLDDAGQQIADAEAMLELSEQDGDKEALAMSEEALIGARELTDALEFQRMFSGKMDDHDAYLEVTAGSGGTEAQDWAEMLLRMYLKWCESKGFEAKLVEWSPGEVAGIKSATLDITGDHAYGWARTETGVHRLVRKSPFDSGNRRHTSFAAVFVSPQIENDIDIKISPADLRIDVYRASGAGGQHVNKTDSAVRITHTPTGVVAQCQSDRSQHTNRDMAMQQLRAKLYRLEMDKLQSERQAAESEKPDIGWGNQVRSYVLDQSRIKDLRTRHEASDTQAVLDGRLDPFIEASLKQGV